MPFFSELVQSEHRFLRLYKFHCDHVTSSPESAIKIGDSSKCGVEALVSKDKRMLSFQSHPEYT